MRLKQYIKELGKAFLLGIGIFIVLLLIRYFSGQGWLPLEYWWSSFWLNQLFSVTLYGVNMVIVDFCLSRYRSQFFQLRYLSIAFAGHILVTLIAIFFLNAFADMVVNGLSWEAFLDRQSLTYYQTAFIISMVLTVVFYVFYYWKYKKDRQVTEQKIIAGAATASFDALKNQLDPHFLFNSLNVLTSLIEENPDQAQKFTTSLSKVYRYVLEQKSKQLVPLSEELAFAKTYMSLLKMRFEDSVVFEIDSSAAAQEAKIVPLALQLLLENAVKHNAITPEKKLKVTVSATADRLLIRNNRQPKESVKKSSGVGLQNIRQRYALLTRMPIEIDQNEDHFQVSIPLIKNEIIMQTQEDYLTDKRYARAKEQVEKMKGFYSHFAIYLFMCVVFIWLNFRSGGFPWAIFPIAGWGLGVAGHAADTFNWNPIFDRDWEERKIREFMDKDNL
ncbi:histidine kinase [Croceiramulus getboli]|nr:histidine kinase [Flavobacteriaceae bacterium YJPT1-3]